MQRSVLQIPKAGELTSSSHYQASQSEGSGTLTKQLHADTSYINKVLTLQVGYEAYCGSVS